jgi:hypothetical protein
MRGEEKMNGRAFAAVSIALGSLVIATPAIGARGFASEELHTVRLRNGSILRGRLVRFENGEFTMILAGTQSRAIIHVADVERIDFGEAAPVHAEAPRAPEATAETRSAPEPAASLPAEAVALPQYREYTVRVPANAEWTDTGITLVRGQKLRLAVSGRVRISPTREVGPEGIELSDPGKLMPDRPSGGLIAVIGDDNDDFIFIGPAAELVAHRSGQLYLMVNDGELKDNSGEFTVRIQVSEPPQAAKKP